MYPRIYINIGILVGILYTPWWFGVLALVLGFVFIERFYEGIVLAAIADTLYGVSYRDAENLYLTYLFMAVILFIVLMFLRTRLSFYALS